MTHLEYVNVCRAVTQGQDRKLENHNSHLIGEVLSCSADYFNVRVGEGWRVWARQDCEEAEPGLGIEEEKTSRGGDWVI